MYWQELGLAFSNKTTRHTWAPLPRCWFLWENTSKRWQNIVQERKEWRKELWETALHSPRLVKKREEVLHSWGTDSLAAWQDHVKAICPLQPTEDHTGEESKYFMKETAAHGTDPLRNSGIGIGVAGKNCYGLTSTLIIHPFVFFKIRNQKKGVRFWEESEWKEF